MTLEECKQQIAIKYGYKSFAGILDNHWSSERYVNELCELYATQKNNSNNNKMENKQYAVMVEGKSTPTKLYTDYETVLTEAKRLASQEKKTTYVLLAITKLELNDVKVTPLNIEEKTE